MGHQPAILGSPPIFEQLLPIVRPTLPAFDGDLAEKTREILETGRLTKGPYLAAMEDRTAENQRVPHAVAVSSCTLGLLLTYRALELEGEVLVPSFTFMATVHPLLWIGAQPVFVDIDPETWNLDPACVESGITSRTSAIVGLHNFGNPAPVRELVAIAERHDVRLIFDAAHGFGALYRGQPLGSFGIAEVFSMSPTKLLITGEGGMVTTRDGALAKSIRISREYGNPGGYDSIFPGLNARLPEFNALLGLYSLDRLEQSAIQRNQCADWYRTLLADVPGLRFQRIHPEDRCSYKDLSVYVDEEAFGLTRDQLETALAAENVDTRKYYDPPVHQQQIYRRQGSAQPALPVTERVARRSISLPIWSHMEFETVEKLAEAIRAIQAHAPRIERMLPGD